MQRERREKEHGSYLVLGAFILVTLLLASALTVDMARKFRLEQIQQDIADGAAAAAAANLPDLDEAEKAAMRYIAQHIPDSASYIGAMDTGDIRLAVTANNTTGTAGVIVHGQWTPIFLPRWIGGGEMLTTSRYAVAVASWQLTSTGNQLTIDGQGLGDLAFFIGDTQGSVGEPACGAEKEAKVNGNNFKVSGGTQINHDFLVNGTADFNGPVNIAGDNNTTDPGVRFNQGETAGAPVIAMPKLDEDAFEMDIVIDMGDPDAAAYYGGGGYVDLVAKGPDGDFGTADDIPIYSDNGSCGGGSGRVQIKMTGTVNGNVQWEMTGDANERINSDCFANKNSGTSLGNGLDIKFVGDVFMKNLDGMDGFIWTTGSLKLDGSMNADFRMTSDNPGMVIYTGPPGDPTKESLLVNANLSQESFYGLIYVNGNCKFDGNGSNNEDTIRGGLWAKRLDADCAGVINGNNWGIFGDASIIGGIPLDGDPPSTTQSTPRVRLVR